MTTLQQQFSVSFTYPVIFTRDLFALDNPVLANVMLQGGHEQSRAMVVLDSEVSRLTPGLSERISRYFDALTAQLKFVAPPFIVRGGEICKHDSQEVEQIHVIVERQRLCRHSFIIAIGGGAVLDAAGYAAATAHRGVRLVRVPTTVLAQNDAGVGVKNGINAFGRKNFVGTFAPPFAVINDALFLKTLDSRDLRGGIAEAVKVALIRDRPFFDFLVRERSALARFAPEQMEQMIFRCAKIHLQHIGQAGDPFEYGSSRPLDFGHWNAHKLEELTHGEMRHGEAVAIGIALDSLYSFHSGLLGKLDLHRILTLLEELGFSLYHSSLSWLDVENSLQEFREHLGGKLSIPLLVGIGRMFEAHEIDTVIMKRCIDQLAEWSAKRESAHKLVALSTAPAPVTEYKHGDSP